MARKNIKPAPGKYVWFSVPVDGAGLVVAADRLPDRPDWLVVLAFKVGRGDTRLVGHCVIERPVDWPESGPQVAASFAGMFTPNGGEHHLTTAIVRSAATTELERHVRKLIVARRPFAPDNYADMAWGGSVEPGTPEKRTRSRSAGDLLRAQIAARYVELLSETDKPKLVLADERGYSVNTINRYLFDARERGFLTSAGQGRAGGELTPLGRRILSEGDIGPE